MKRILKKCAGCGKDSIIWKNHNGQKYCRQCSEKLLGKAKKPAQVSIKHRKKLKEYSKMRKSFLELPQNRSCKAKLPGCTGLDPDTLTIHHAKGRGKYLLDENTWIPLCGNCHRWVTDNHKEALETGLSFSKTE
jgi:DNA-directed RNA polymerase subunit RPC12/RpoP